MKLNFVPPPSERRWGRQGDAHGEPEETEAQQRGLFPEGNSRGFLTEEKLLTGDF